MMTTTPLAVVQFKRHKTAYIVAAAVTLTGAIGAYFLLDNGGLYLNWILPAGGICLSAYCTWNAFSNEIVVELNPDGIKYKQYFYRWHMLRSYSIYEEEHEGSSFNYLVLNLKNAKVPLEIQLDWINDQESLKQHMIIYAEAFHIEFEGVLKKK